MALVKAKEVADDVPINYISPIAARIQQLRYSMLVTSLLYYEADYSLIPDHEWSEKAKELVSLQNENPLIAEKVIFAKAFEGFTGDTGYHLPYTDYQIIRIAFKLVKDDDVRDKLAAIKPRDEEWQKYRKEKHTETPAPKTKEEKHGTVTQPQTTGRKTLFGGTRK